MDFMEEKFKMVLHYIIYKCGFKNTVGRTVLHKLFYFSDFNHYELFNKSITNETFKIVDKFPCIFSIFNKSITNETHRKMARGPVPIHFEEAIVQLVDENKIRLRKRKLPCGKTMNRYFALEAPEIELNQDELDVIDQFIKDLSHMNGKQIGEYALSDEPVKRTAKEEIVEYDLVQTRQSKEQNKVFVKII